MLHKMRLALVVLIFLLAFSLPVFATDNDQGINSIIGDRYIESTEQFLVTITRPEGDENTFNKSYVICGVTSNPDIQVALARYDEATGAYENFFTTDGVSSWDAGSLFTKEVILNEGPNKIKVVAYKRSEVDNLNPGVNVQVSKFTITVLKESWKDKILNGMLKITDIFEGILPK